MIKKVFYNSSLPRAGSTLFQNIVGQNLDFYVTPTSGTNATAPVEFLDPTNKIKLDITYTPAGYSKKVIGVDPASIGRVNGVLSANISKVIGIS